MWASEEFQALYASCARELERARATRGFAHEAQRAARRAVAASLERRARLAEVARRSITGSAT